MVSRTFLAGALAALSARVVIAGPCRPISSSAAEVSYSSAATDPASATLVSSSSETPSTETLSTETETLETSLTVPTTDGTTSTVIEQAITTTTDDFTTTELATSDATSYQTTETTIIDSEPTSASETTTTTAETTTSEAAAVPSTFKLISEGGNSDGSALKGLPGPGYGLYFGNKPRFVAIDAIFTYDEQTSQLSFLGQKLCVYRDEYSWNAQVAVCSPEDRYAPLLCEKPTTGELKCRMPGSQCDQEEQCPPEIPDCTDTPAIPVCGPTGEEWSQFYVRSSGGMSYDLYFGIEDASAEQLAELEFQSTSLQILRVDDTIINT
ncbi:unnamed protein product [Fusarium equiseti]|uniref:Uncharacterized protein n=1 Tax=Fusarium equiseti TaxID=61235 RepID=A0A8J2NPV9_FUSEQ|nr:unnamed protein product [Fusarium equiseti]